MSEFTMNTTKDPIFKKLILPITVCTIVPTLIKVNSNDVKQQVIDCNNRQRQYKGRFMIQHIFKLGSRFKFISTLSYTAFVL